MQQIILTGSTGFVGRNFLRMSSKYKINVLPVVRSIEKGQSLGITDFLLFNELTSLKLNELGITDCTIIHLAGESRDEINNSLWDSIVISTEAVVKVSKERNVKRIIYLSGYGVTENSSDRYFAAKAKAEDLIVSSGVPYSIFRCSYILGNGDELTPFIIDNLLKGQIEIPGDGLYSIQPIYIDDVINVLVNCAMKNTTISHKIDLLGNPISYIEFVNLLASKVVTGVRIKRIPLENFLQRAIFSSDPEFTLSELAILVCNNTGDPTLMCFDIKLRCIEDFADELVKHYV